MLTKTESRLRVGERHFPSLPLFPSPLGSELWLLFGGWRALSGVFAIFVVSFLFGFFSLVEDLVLNSSSTNAEPLVDVFKVLHTSLHRLRRP